MAEKELIIESKSKSRKDFIKIVATTATGLLIMPWHVPGIDKGLPGMTDFSALDEEAFDYQSDYIKLQLSKRGPNFTFFSTDSLGGAQFKTNPVFKTQFKSDENYNSKISNNSISYYPKNSKKPHSPFWEIKCRDKDISIRTQWSSGQDIGPLEITFSQELNHCTALGTMAGENQLKFPCVLHFPGMGTFRLLCSDPGVTLFYDADRKVEKPFVKIALPAANSGHRDITYTFESVIIFPKTDNVTNDPRFDGFKRNFINIFQLNPRIKSLANNSASDACAFTLFLYAEMARRTPQMVEGLTAMDLIRNSLERYLNGMFAYGQVGYTTWDSEYDSSDSAPSLIISACYYILETKDYDWARKNYEGIRQWAVKMIKTDKNNDGIIEYGYSGNADSWDSTKRPANWWDTIGFGHDDAYSNALAYKACTLLSEVASALNNDTDNNHFASFATKLKSNYYKFFYNPVTGVLGGWRSKDGQLHDYYFTFVNSIAICYGLLDDDQGKAVMISLLNKMKEVGYTNFRLGIPGNMIPIRREDYTHFDRRWGYGKDEEGSDGFQIYENGGATACYAYFTIKALYKLGMKKEADSMLLPMLESFKNSDFEGKCPDSKMTKDWKTWSGECWGYEGFLADNYLTLLAVIDH